MNSTNERSEQEECLAALSRRLLVYAKEKSLFEVSEAECIMEAEEESKEEKIGLEELELAPAKLDDLKADLQDPLEEVELGENGEKRPTFISQLLDDGFKVELIALLKEFKDCFAWDYHEMPGLDRKLVEHQLPIRPGFRPFKQPPRRMTAEVTLKVKEEVERLLKAGFIVPISYAEWVSSVVPVVKKNGKLRVCVDFRHLNLATPKDEYPMPVADVLVDRAAGHEILSFMDGHSGYNQIFIDEEEL